VNSVGRKSILLEILSKEELIEAYESAQMLKLSEEFIQILDDAIKLKDNLRSSIEQKKED
jgi:hypothetical protein